MSRADEIFIQNCRDILDNGVWDTDREVRPHWEDGASAHTVKKFGIVNRYDLSNEFPILTIRRTYWKSAIDELLWIWQAKSNNVHDLRTRVWDAWADENGSIGKAYGYQLGVKHHYPEGDMDQVDKVLWDLKHNPASRRIMTNIYNFVGNGALPLRVLHDLQRRRQQAQRHTEPAFAGHARREQLERRAVRRADNNAGAGLRL